MRYNDWMTNKDYGYGIFVYKNSFPTVDLDTLQDIMFHPAQTSGAGVNDEIRSCEVSSETNTQLLSRPTIEPVMSGTERVLDDYRTRFYIEPLYSESWSLIKYHVGGHYIRHIDDCARFDRTVSVVAYLNDGYTGGSVEFPIQEITINPEAGDILIFPSTYSYPHVVYPVESGERYVMINWYNYGR